MKEVVARLDPARFRVTMLGDGAADTRIAERPNTEIIAWGKRGNTARILAKLLYRPPHVYFFPREGPLDAAFLSARARLGLRTALVTYVVSGGLEESSKSDRPLLWRAVGESDVVAANSRWMTERVRRLFGKENVHTVYDGIDRRYYYGRPENEMNARPKRIFFAGSFRGYKRVDLVIVQAAKFPDWEFRLAGAGEEEHECRKMAGSANCRNVVFLGHLSAAQLGEEMRQAQLFFLPSEIEGHPQVLGQAAACGLPSVARNSYQPDYVVDGVTGLLGNSDEELGAAVQRLMEDSKLRAEMSGAAIEHAAKFDWDNVTKQWASIFDEAMMRREKQRRK